MICSSHERRVWADDLPGALLEMSDAQIELSALPNASTATKESGRLFLLKDITLLVAHFSDILR